MSITAKMTLFFESLDAEGWSESTYHSATDINEAATFIVNIVAKRADMLDSHFSIIYARVSDVAVKGDSLVSATQVFPVVGTLLTSGDQLEANTALNVELFNSASIKNRLFIRGLNSGVVKGREYLGPVNFTTAFTAWSAQQLTNGSQCRHRTSVGPPPVYTYVDTATFSVVGATARKPGRPFGLPVGRRKRR